MWSEKQQIQLEFDVVKLQLVGARAKEIRTSVADSTPTFTAYEREEHFRLADFKKPQIWRTLPQQFQHTVERRNLTSTDGDVLKQ